ncbi:MAG: hypothetical protein NDJ24_07110 [Alphaproteobacteria bacterium]|nr:hypothetical protein [Alphaproteobacteria bacterium]
MKNTKDLAILSRIFQIVLLAIFAFSISFYFDLGNMREGLGCTSYGIELTECDAEFFTFMVWFLTPYALYTLLMTVIMFPLIFTSLHGFGMFIGAIIGIILQVFSVAAFVITIYEMTIGKVVAAIMPPKEENDAAN